MGMRIRKKFDSKLYDYLNGQYDKKLDEEYKYPLHFEDDVVQTKYADIYKIMSKIPNLSSMTISNKIFDFVKAQSKMDPDMEHIYKRMKTHYLKNKLEETTYPLFEKDRYKIDIVDMMGDYKNEKRKRKAINNSVDAHKNELMKDNLNLNSTNQVHGLKNFMHRGYTKPKKGSETKNDENDQSRNENNYILISKDISDLNINPRFSWKSSQQSSLHKKRIKNFRLRDTQSSFKNCNMASMSINSDEKNDLVNTNENILINTNSHKFRNVTGLESGRKFQSDSGQIFYPKINEKEELNKTINIFGIADGNSSIDIKSVGRPEKDYSNLTHNYYIQKFMQEKKYPGNTLL